MLTFDGVIIAQGDFHLAADLTISKGLTAVIGPSGAGKSTLLGAAAGFVSLKSGRIVCDASDVTAAQPGARPISMLFQDHNLFPHLTITQNIGLGLRPNLRMTAEETSRVKAAIGDVGLDGFGDRKPGTLSGGQQSRAALARVLLADRPVVLLDEPFSALGPALKDEMLRLVQRTLVDAGKTVLMVTHDPDDAESIADHVVLVAEGAATGPFDTEAVFANPPAALMAYQGTRVSRRS